LGNVHDPKPVLGRLDAIGPGQGQARMTRPLDVAATRPEARFGGKPVKARRPGWELRPGDYRHRLARCPSG
jgi:hypothetical protein